MVVLLLRTVSAGALVHHLEPRYFAPVMGLLALTLLSQLVRAGRWMLLLRGLTRVSYREALWVNASTQTVGVYPDSLKETLRDLLPLYGAQRLVSLGYAADPGFALPQDAIEPVRRMVRWIVDESCDPNETRPPWSH